ncbi:hypothetical protein LCGC14_2410290, partial [marine sediment metagenome]
PACIRCHVVAFAMADGFRGVALSPDRIDVQCEGCHGRATDHVRARKAGKDPAVGRLTKVLPNSCRTCHDWIHSPTFSYDTYWERIKHGKEPTDK